MVTERERAASPDSSRAAGERRRGLATIGLSPTEIARFRRAPRGLQQIAAGLQMARRLAITSPYTAMNVKADAA
jgi:hypothetical protein